MTVGNCTDAATALDSCRAHDPTYMLSEDGTTRWVYLINGVVYKVDTEGEYNALEYENINAFRDHLPEGMAFPNVSLYNVNGENIIAMDYIEGQEMAKCYCVEGESCFPDCAPDDVSDIMDKLDLDSGGLNIILRDGIYFIVDAG